MNKGRFKQEAAEEIDLTLFFGDSEAYGKPNQPGPMESQK